MTDNKISSGPGGYMFSGPLGVAVYRATVIASALRLYAKSGMKANRNYTPANMLQAAHDITGHKFKRGQYLQAADALTAWARDNALTIQKES